MSTAPAPASLVFMSDLKDLAIEAKVRFLGCVVEYDVKTGTVLLTHHYPASSASQTVARVNIDLVLESIESSSIQIGSWVNVIGYISAKTVQSAHQAEVRNIPVNAEVAVRAILLWGAGDFKLKSYEDRLQERKDAGTTG